MIERIPYRAVADFVLRTFRPGVLMIIHSCLFAMKVLNSTRKMRNMSAETSNMGGSKDLGIKLEVP